MIQPESIKKIKCTACHKRFKLDKNDVLAIREDCQIVNCGLKHKKWDPLWEYLQGKPVIEILEIEIEDPLVVEVKRGKWK